MITIYYLVEEDIFNFEDTYFHSLGEVFDFCRRFYPDTEVIIQEKGEKKWN